ncbi:MAG: agmatine deiminase family protein [Henriciella sp.]|nr:agmatine deiminase family protein [Henriciella sp.]
MGRAMVKQICPVPEWAEQAALWVGWPHLPDEWGDTLDPARAEIARFIQTVSQTVRVQVACGSGEAYRTAQQALNADGGRIELLRVPSGDIWLRDTGPVYVEAEEQGLALCFAFNGWGEKFVMPGDTLTAEAIAKADRICTRLHPFVLEGGAVDFDGAGRALTTRQCLLHPNRKNAWTEAEAAETLRATFGVSDVIWLDDGLINDHTDGHVDNLARFIGPGRVICQRRSGPDDPNAGVFAACQSALEAAGLEVVTLPSPGRILNSEGELMPASHMNFLISNGVLVLPVYDSVYSAQAVRTLQVLLAELQIVPLPAGAILAGGGSFHCMTREVPRFPIQSVK